MKFAIAFALILSASNAHALTPDSDICIARDFSYFHWSTETGCDLLSPRRAGDGETAIVFDAYCPSEEGAEYLTEGTAAVMPTDQDDVYWIAATFGDDEITPYLAGICLE